MNTTHSFSTIYEQGYKRTLNLVNSRVYNMNIAEEITSDIYVKVYRFLDTYKPEYGTISTWVGTITKNAILDYQRSKANSKAKNTLNVDGYVNEEGEPLFQFEDNNLASDAIEKKELMKQVKYAFTKLSANAQKVAYMFFIQQRKQIEIAEILGMSEVNVKVTILRAKEVLKSNLALTYSEL